MRKIYLLLVILISGAWAPSMSALKITSPSFKNNQTLDNTFVHTQCGGQNFSPRLIWSEVPKDTKSFVLICEDPDAPRPEPWVHWAVYNIPKNIRSLKENQSIPLIQAQQGLNSWGKARYDGPCPPKGHGVHRYIFTLYALDIEKLIVTNSPNKKTMEKALQGHILAQATIIGLYQVL